MPRRRNNNNNNTSERLRKKLAVKQGPKKLCLTMIVKNESRNMPRLLESVKTIVDMISIVDTGSTDDTEQVILNWATQTGIPTKVHHEPFKDFAHNRTHSIHAAKEAFPEADYFLLSDADFIWDLDQGCKFDKVLLVDHKYLIEQYNKALSYWNIRLLSAKVDWECVGVTHEYWTEAKKKQTYAGEVRTSKITTLRINDLEDGGCKNDKFERDERLLRGGLEAPETPTDLKTRYKFYLAQTLKDMGRFSESIEWYNKRIADKGWPEEVYYAKFQIGYNYEQLGWTYKNCVTLMGKGNKSPEEINALNKLSENLGPAELLAKSNEYFAQAAVNYLAAYHYRKTRAESLYYLTRMYRLLGANQQAFDLAEMGNKIIYPEQDSLFIERGCYDYQFDFEISIVAFYIPTKKDAGREACSRLLGRTDLPDWMVSLVENNSRHYI
jgi:glycosyltransferase involved in cell wall biosynthesis